MKEHHYSITTVWTGNLGQGTSNYKSYNRDHEICIDGKEQSILGSSDSSFLGDASRYNPEELFLASLSSCHMLWYLHLCSSSGVVVTAYTDKARGKMKENANGSGQFTSVTLFPSVTINNLEHQQLAKDIHHKANELCFIANSCNFKIDHQAEIIVV